MNNLTINGIDHSKFEPVVGLLRSIRLKVVK